jgi:thioesterase domain-containing protein/acyl carrier protein
VPAYFGWLESLPLTPNGKLDRRALPPPPDTLPRVTASRAPATLLEQQVASVWQDVLRLEGIGAETDFFRLGGDSLAAISMFLLVEERFGVRLTAAQLAGGSMTVARLAAHIECKTNDDHTAGVITLQPLGTQRPFFCVPGIGGDVLHLWALAQHTSDADRPFLALRGGVEADSSIKSIASRYVAAMVERQPEGPFLLGGYSAGATIAFEMAQQLTALGHRVELLVLIDARSPGWRVGLNNAPAVVFNFVSNLPAWFRYDLMHSGVRQVLRDLRRKLRRRAGGSATVESVIELSHYPAKMQEVMRFTYKALLAYQGMPWIGRVTLLRAKAQPLLRLHDELALGWSALVPLGVIARTLPGNHQTILHEPHVHALASALRGSIAAAEMEPDGGRFMLPRKYEKEVDRCC